MLIDSDEHAYIEEKRTEANLKRIASFIFIILLFEFVSIIARIFKRSGIVYGTSGIAVDFLFILVCVFYSLTISHFVHSKKTGLGFKKLLYMSFWVCFSFFAMFFSTIELKNSGTLNYYAAAVVILSLFAVSSLKEIIPLIGMNFVYQSIIAIVYHKWELAQYCIIAAIMAVIISQLLFSFFVSSYVTQIRLEKTNEKLKELAETDMLTSLLNRRGVEKRLELIWPNTMRSNGKIIAALIDVDYFKLYNDKFGHIKGDECLSVIAECIKEDFRRATDVVSRYGGEEFLVVLTDMDDEHILDFMTRIKTRVEGRKIPAGKTAVSPYVTVSIGVAAVNPEKTMTFKSIFDNADAELYNAKNNGRNCISFRREIYR
ncbi:MAG: GGDEF domain-containing protein [Clostridia bacterium]|nr:GGDEF domain-containing protein [Clostridia bacterium]